MPSTREAIASLLASGLSQSQVARQLDLAPTTVSYHVERILRAQVALLDASDQPPGAQPRTRDAVACLIDEGVPHAEVARRLGISKATVSYHARRLGADIDEPAGRRYDWDAVQRYYDDGHSIRACMRVRFLFEQLVRCGQARGGRPAAERHAAGGASRRRQIPGPP